MPAGRPLKFKSVEELQTKIEEYFTTTEQDKWMVTGLAYFLDTSRETLLDYENKDEFSDAIKKAKARIEMAYEARGIKRGSSFDIFALKNFGWKDRKEVDNNNQGTITLKWDNGDNNTLPTQPLPATDTPAPVEIQSNCSTPEISQDNSGNQ